MSDETDEGERDGEEDIDVGAGPIDVAKVFRTIVQTLQQEPVAYKRFGIYWWPVKALLKRAGYTKDQLFLLGGFQDRETAAMVPRMNLEDTLRTALEEYKFNVIHPHADGRVENEDGELVSIIDDDAGF